MTNLLENLAVCSWSLQPENLDVLIDRVRATGISRIQIALDPIRESPQAWNDTVSRLRGAGIQLVSGMFGTVGEDYSTMEAIRRTGGLVPDSTWETNWAHALENARLARSLNLKLVTFHAGFIPHDPSDSVFKKLVERIRRVADLYRDHGIDLAFETGQETAVDLKSFLGLLDRANVGVNFDPANMLLYDKGDPIAALKTLAPFLRQCHLKDAIKTKVPGTWGEEVTVGTGEVRWAEFFKVIREIGFPGNLCFEREAGGSRVADIQAGRKFVTGLLS